MATVMDNKILQRKIGYFFQNQSLLVEALTHPSFAAENERVAGHNQRLEFLGDAVLQILVTERLFRDHVSEPEGVMTRMRAVVTRRPYVAELARRINLGAFLRLGNGEAAAGGADRDSNLCDALEALLGAIFIDSGGLAAAAMILGELMRDAASPAEALAVDNPKGALQELAQRTMHARPQYTLLAEEGPDHEKCFIVTVALGGRVFATGRAGRRQQAEQEAAAAALKLIMESPDDWTIHADANSV